MFSQRTVSLPPLPRRGISWRQGYDEALTRGKSWLDLISEGDQIFIGSAAGEPVSLVDGLAMSALQGDLPSVTVAQMFAPRQHRLLDAAGERFKVVGLNVTPEFAPVIAAGHAAFLPLTIFQLARALADGLIRFDVCLIQVGSPDGHGRMSLGISVDLAAAACTHSRIVIAEVNSRMPRAEGDCLIHVSEIAAVVEVSRELPEVEAAAPDAEAKVIGALTADLVPDGATIEVGIGEVMTAIVNALDSHKDLGLHTGLLVDPMIDLVEAGVLTNARKGIDVGMSVANQARGTRRLYEFLDSNPLASMRPATYTHDPKVLSQLGRFRALNSALEVDLMGQVNSELVEGRRVASASGLPDFVRAARNGNDSRSIIALRSTARGRAVSRIVPILGARSGVTLTADLADIVVTEHGVADLRNLTSAERAERMVAIADPAFRDELHAAIGAGG